MRAIDSPDNCVICKGTGKYFDARICPYCNGTGEGTPLAEEYMRNHICQCLLLDRKFCPVCNKACHHDSTLSPKQKIDPGYGGISSKKISSKKPKQELVIK